MKPVPKLRNAVTLMRMFLETVVVPGSKVVDATVGNGNDTLLLCRLAGPEGTVYGFDIQEAALERTRALLAENGCDALLHALDHQQMEAVVPEPVDLVLFNLGYLPGGDKSVTTKKESTLCAMQAGLRLLKPGGFLAAVLYGGHPQGFEEATAVLEWASRLDQKVCDVLNAEFLNQVNHPPQLILIEKKGTLL